MDKPFNIEMVVCSQKNGLVSNVAFLVSVFMLFGFPGCSSSVDFEMAIKPGSVRISATEILLGVDLG